MANSGSHLVLGPTPSSFPQTGSWNMLDLSKLPIQATLGVLSRYSAARVNPYTALVGEVLCQNFQLTSTGRKTVEKVIGGLRVIGTMGDALETGFGVEDVVRTMAKTERGCVCLALCSALKECYSDDIAVEVLHEMARLVNVEGQYMPSSQSWKDLLSTCAGTLATSKFPSLAEHLMQLPEDGDRLGAFRRLTAIPTSVRSCSRPKSIAEALFGLARISRGEIKALTVYGGSDAGWLAALAEWLFDMNVMITNFNGGLCYTNRLSEDVQIHVVMRKKDDEIAPSILRLETTFVLEEISQIFEKEARDPAASLVSGRVDWSRALSSAFVSDFKHLMEISHTVGECIGSAARLMKGLAQADESFPSFPYRLACTSYCDAAHGAGLVLNTTQWFPELKRLEDIMLKGAAKKLASARNSYEACLSLIRSHCNCVTCRSKRTGHGVEEEDDEDDISMPLIGEDDPETDETSDDDWDPDKFCEVVITETIIVLSRMLANTVLEDRGLLPTRSGFELAYGRQMNYRLSAPLGRQALRDVGPVAFCLDFDNNFSFGLQENNDDGVGRRLRSTLELFSGRRSSMTRSNFSALCTNGICAFLDMISSPGLGGADIEATARIRVLPGRIYYEKKSYNMLIDRVEPGPIHLDGFKNAVKFTHIPASLIESQLNIRETYTGLEVSIEIKYIPGSDDDRNREPEKVLVGPSQLTELIASRRGLVSCKRSRNAAGSVPRRDCPWSGPVSLREVRAAAAEQRSLRIHDKLIDVLRYQDMSSAIAAVASSAELDPAFSIFITEKECLSCCIKTVLAVDRPERPNFAILMLPT